MDGGTLALLATVLATIMNVGAIAVGIFKMGRAVEKFEQIGTQQAEEIKELKQNVEVVGELVTKLALQTQRQDSLEKRMDRHEATIEDLRRGEGFIMGLGTHYHPSKT